MRAIGCITSTGELNTFQPSRNPSADWWSHSAGAGGASQYRISARLKIVPEHSSPVNMISCVRACVRAWNAALVSRVKSMKNVLYRGTASKAPPMILLRFPGVDTLGVSA